MNTILKIHTNTDVFYVCPPPAIEQSRNLSDNAVAWAKEVFKDVTLVQFVRKRPDTLMCLIDIEKFETPMWEFIIFVNDVKPEDFNDQLMEQVEQWLDTRIHNMLQWAERT